MKHGCLALSGLGLTSLFVFGVTLEAINDPKELSAIPFTPWDFITCGLIAIVIPAFVSVVRKRDLHKTLSGKWTSNVTHNGARFRTTLRLDPDGNAEIQTKETAADSEQKLRTSARWQLLDDRTLNLSGAQSVTWNILKLNGGRMTTTGFTDPNFQVKWTKQFTINAKAFFLIGGAVLLPIFFALSLLRSEPSHAIANDPRYVLPTTSHRAHQLRR
jgi:hypothetical protein